MGRARAPPGHGRALNHDRVAPELVAFIRGIAEQQADQGAFLWTLRDWSVKRRHLRLCDVASIDRRLDAHLEGLRLAGTDACELCRPPRAHAAAGEMFLATRLALDMRDVRFLTECIEAASSNGTPPREMASAFAWSGSEFTESALAMLGSSRQARHRRIAVSAAACLRTIAHVERFLADGDQDVRARALRGAGELGALQLLPEVRACLDAEHEGTRFGAAWSGTLLGDRAAADALGAFALDGGPHAERACMLGLRRMGLTAAHATHGELVTRSQRRLAVVAAGIIGDPVLIDWLLEQMHVSALARVAGEAFTMITGADLEDRDLQSERPADVTPGPTDDPADESVSIDPDHGLPWPATERVEQWWHVHRRAFLAGTRYLLGSPITEKWLRDVLRVGRQGQRAAAAVELALLCPGLPLFNVKAPAFHQQRMVGL